MQSVLFDPGYSECIYGVADSVTFMYEVFSSSYMPLKQKKFQFSVLINKIKYLIRKNVGFYLGCLLWASRIKNEKDASIENNPCLGDTYNEESALCDVLELYNFITEKLNKESVYYLNRKYEPDKTYLTILETYMEFVKINKGFVQTTKTKELLLPENIKSLDKSGCITVEEKIKEAIEKKDLTLLFNVYSLILD